MVKRMAGTFQASVLVKHVLWDRFLVYNHGVTFNKYNNLEITDCTLDTNVTCETQVRKHSESKDGLKNNGDVYISYGIADKICKLSIESGFKPENKIRHEKNRAHGSLRLFVNGYLLSYFVNTLQESTYYRKSVISHFSRCCRKGKQLPQSHLQVLIKLTYPRKDIIDYAWNYRIDILVVERRELENAMSWLSTLGGAFSALGDQFERCAEVAGRISVQQLKIAMRLGDPYTVARCKLYLALSLLQRDQLKPAKRIILQQYKLAKTPPILDHRLVRMCLGIWARFKYEHSRKQRFTNSHV